MATHTIYIDEAGDLGVSRGTQWFVLSGVIVNNSDEAHIRNTISAIRKRLNVNEIHMRNINDFNRRVYIAKSIVKEAFTFINIIIDTNKLHFGAEYARTYNYACRLLLERASWWLRDHNGSANVILSARGTSRDNDLIMYIGKLTSYDWNNVAQGTIVSVKAKPASAWDLLQLADICATSTFWAYEKNGWGFTMPCYLYTIANHLYRYCESTVNYGMKYYDSDMAINFNEYSKQTRPCAQIDIEKAPGATTTS